MVLNMLDNSKAILHIPESAVRICENNANLRNNFEELVDAANGMTPEQFAAWIRLANRLKCGRAKNTRRIQSAK